MVINLNRGPFLNIPDKAHPGQFLVIRNPDWDGELPDIITFTEFLKWNYTLDYGRYIRDLHDYGILPLPWGVPENAAIENVIIKEGYYDRIDHNSFRMYVICEVYFIVDGYSHCQEYVVHGVYESYGESDFLKGVELYDGKYIRLKNPLDACLVPRLNKKQYKKIAKEILEEYYPFEINTRSSINVFAIAHEMGLAVRYARLSKNIEVKVKSKLIHERRDTVVYNERGEEVIMRITKPTILIDESIKDKVEEYSAVVHECVHAYLHNLFYELQSHYRRMVNAKIPEFNDYNYSKTQRNSIRWMEVQANTIPRYVQAPAEQAEEVIISYLERLVGEPDWPEYRELIDHVKGQFRLARNTAKKVIVDAGWSDVRGVYVYNVTGYVDDYDVPYNFPDDHTYTLSLRHIAEITEISEEFADLINSGRFIYLDGHVILNNDTYVEHIDGFPYKLTEYAKRHMSECCLDFKRIYDDPDYEYTFGELHKDDLPPIEKREADEAALRRVKELFAEEEAENSRLKNTPTVSPFGQAVIFHMKRCGVTEDDVADRSGLGVNTISNMRAGKKVKLETVLAFCVALDLEEAFREDLRKKAGVDFDMNNKAHRFYMTILKLCPDFNVFQYNQLCEDNGIKPWTKERQQTKRYAKKGQKDTAPSDESSSSVSIAS
ncbi:helix-turn-helix transcriptional regulator [Ruminococcus flavefaciens]|uniref:helix-turn-helix domain-containing protein n=1 Tax=Ruminococcus flavefaciens TaxID=1265 RepID=UPI0026F33EB4|nr:helix-turn-helix transcriptional regulator [Ruminococcus flavefaciens]